MPSLLLLALSFHLAAARLLHSLPEDTYAFPKYRVTFLNGLPVLNDTAERWLKDGLRGGEAEFLEQSWKEDRANLDSPLKEIGSGDAQAPFAQPPTPDYSLEIMKMGSRSNYLCLIPNPLEHIPVVPSEPEAETTPVRSWSLLQPLTGTCLYHHQGWFTYSYCHNEEIRQFKELVQARPLASGGYKPEEDPDWESYTLGRAPATSEPGADLTVAEELAIAANLELARGAGSRYLVQRWGDGTVCDKTGKKRETEVQFHCSMTMTDTILFVKEARTCSYVLVIHTPRLCGEPGFKSRLDAREEAYIRCREVVDADFKPHTDQASLPEADHPLRLPRRTKPILGASAPAAAADKGKPHGKDTIRAIESLVGAAQPVQPLYGEALARALEALVSAQDLDELRDAEFHVNDKGDIVIEFVEELDIGEDAAGDGAPVPPGLHDALASALRAAGFDIKGEKPRSGTGEKGSKEEKKGDQEDTDIRQARGNVRAPDAL